MSCKVVGIGEALWDLLPAGRQLGGAPANFAYHAKMLGADSQIVTRIGHDADGKGIARRFEDMGIRIDTVQVDDRRPTGTATVLGGNGASPKFIINDNVAWDFLEPTEEAEQAARAADAVCFGTLAQRHHASGSVIRRLVASAPPEALRVFDVNLRQQFYNREVIEQSLQIANVLKLNDQELPVLGAMFDLHGPVGGQIEQLGAKFSLRIVALTRGPQGSLLYQAGNWSELPGRTVAVVDTVGAGDSFTAGLVMGLLAGMNLNEVHRLAADIAAFVCSQPGATPALPGHFRAALAAYFGLPRTLAKPVRASA
jgi:fructokinase